jgi:glutamate racemase
MRIGFFDSGLGGLTILEAVRVRMPEYDYLFYGDTANLPYGDKTEEEVFVLTKNAVSYLFDHGALLVVVACNTASAETLRRLQDTLLVGPYASHKLLGVIIPTIEELVERGVKKALLIGTARTVGSHKYDRELEKISAGVELTSVATPGLVPAIESNDMGTAYKILGEVIGSLRGEVGTIILGCTHYTVLKDHLRETYGFEVLSQDEIIPGKLETYLQHHEEIESRLSRGGSLEVVTSGRPLSQM